MWWPQARRLKTTVIYCLTIFQAKILKDKVLVYNILSMRAVREGCVSHLSSWLLSLDVFSLCIFTSYSYACLFLCPRVYHNALKPISHQDYMSKYWGLGLQYVKRESTVQTLTILVPEFANSNSSQIVAIIRYLVMYRTPLYHPQIPNVLSSSLIAQNNLELRSWFFLMNNYSK